MFVRPVNGPPTPTTGELNWSGADSAKAGQSCAIKQSCTLINNAGSPRRLTSIWRKMRQRLETVEHSFRTIKGRRNRFLTKTLTPRRS
jgi:hypothetical protein